MKLSRSLLSFALIPLLLVGLFLPAPALQAAGAAGPFSPSARQVLDDLPANQRATFIITLRDQLADQPGSSPLKAAAALPGKAARQQAVIAALQAYARQQQAGLLVQARRLQDQDQVEHLLPFWIVNGVSLEATPAAIRALAARPEVARVDPDPDPSRRIVPLGTASPASPQPEPNVTLVNAPGLWSLGYTGQGVVVASLDTGVDGTHTDLAPSYRGGSNSWYDPYGQNPQPTDNAGSIYTGHGTMTMGLMVGGSNGGTAIGMAPGAQWIAAKIFDNSGSAAIAAIHLSFQWVISAGADVVNNSWGYTPVHTCDTTFQPDIQALLAAGILPVFAAGNSGPALQTDNSPANIPGAFSVGATDNNDNIVSFSSRGPGACSASLPFPYLVAPGWALKSSYPNNQYFICTGTSCAAPEVSGALALLLSANPYLSVNFQQEALIKGAHPLTPTVPDPGNAYGYGQMDVLQSHNWLGPPMLTAPGSLQAAVVSPAQIDLTWADTNTNETGYQVLRSPNGQTGWASIATTAADATSYSDSSSLSEGTTYYYLVRAVNASLGYTSSFASASVTFPLVAPTSVTATAVSPSQVELTWVDTNSNPNETGYEVQRSPDGQTGWAAIATTAADTTSYSDSSGLSEGTTYYYRVRAVNTIQGYTSNFNTASATTLLLAPTGFTAAAVSSTQIDLSWGNNSQYAGGTLVQRSPDGTSGWATLGTAPAGVTTFSDSSGLVEGTPYYYRVQTVNAAQTLASLYASASAVTPLLAPSGLVAAPISNTQVNLFWTNHSTRATGYEVQRSPDGLGSWVTLTAALPGTATSYSDTNLLPGITLYYYQVRATGSVPGSESPFTPPAHTVTGPDWIYFPVISR